MTKSEFFKRIIVLTIGIFFVALGVAFTRHSTLGVSPISCVANVLSLKFTFISFGTWVFMSYLTFILCQILILRKNFKPYQFFQLPLSFVCGYFTDLGLYIAGFIQNTEYYEKLIIVFLGCIILGTGICISVMADLILNPGEAIIKVISDVSKKDFGSTKIAFDVFCVITGVILSLILFKGKIMGTREGTLISAIFVGLVVKFMKKILEKPITHFIKGE